MAAVQAGVAMLKCVNQEIATYDKKIATLAEAHPDFGIFDSFPAAGRVFAPRLIAVNAGLGQLTSARDPRIMQLALRFYW